MSSNRKDPAKVDRVPDGDESPAPDDHLTEYSEEDREIEDREPDLGEIEDDSSEL